MLVFGQLGVQLLQYAGVFLVHAGTFLYYNLPSKMLVFGHLGVQLLQYSGGISGPCWNISLW